MEAVLVGAGRTGCRIAPALAKEGWKLTVIDRDCVEKTDLQNSPVFEESDVGLMKAGALAAKVRHYSTEILAVEAHLSGQNAQELLTGAKIVLDASDNWRARAIINQWCWKNAVPWVYCGALSTKAMASAIVPPEPPCWQCWNAGEPAEVASCSVFGIDARAADAAASKAVELAGAIAAGKKVGGKLFFSDVESGAAVEKKLQATPGCPVCEKGEFALLNGTERAELLCGTGQWLFPNLGLAAKVRHYTGGQVAQRLGREAREAGSVVLLEKNGASAIVFAGGRATVRAGSEADARALNDEIVQRLSA